MSNLLILTTGTTDVQIVKDGRRHELHKKTCGALLDQIVNRDYKLCDAPADKALEPIESLAEGELLVCTPKLDAVLHFLEEQQQMPQAVLILETARRFTSDPRNAGAVLEQRLRARGIHQVDRQVFLEDEERLEDSSDSLDAVVRREVVRRLAGFITEAFEKQRPVRVYNALTGGIPEANDVIDELVRLQAIASPQGCRVVSLKVPDRAKAEPDDKAIPEPFHPAAGIRARWHALDLIQKGSLLAAWGAVSHLKNQPGQEWTRVVEWLNCFASSLPIPHDCDIAILTHNRMAVRAALRVEFALRAGDIPRAVHGTVAFFEAAFWDSIGGYDFTAEGITKVRDREYQLPQPLSKDRRFRHQKNGCWRINDFRDGIEAWLPKLNKPALQNLWDALTDDIWNLRNDVAHNEPTPNLMDSARSQMINAQLWSQDNRFLTQQIIQEVLKELGETNPEKLCDNLIATVKTRLLAH